MNDALLILQAPAGDERWRGSRDAMMTHDNDACFVVDTTSGKVWKVGEGEPIVIASKLPE